MRTKDGECHHENYQLLHLRIESADGGNCEASTIERMEALAKGTGGKHISFKELVK